MKIFLLHIKRFFLFLLALQILNLSFDSIEFQPISNANDLSQFNELNTAIEYVSEIILGYVDAFPEAGNDNHSSQKDYSFQKQISIKVYYFTSPYLQQTIKENVSYNLPVNEKIISSLYKEIIPQPPNA